MNASEVGSPDWWSVVLTMPHQESLMYLNEYKISLLKHNVGTPAFNAAQTEISKINNEIKRINKLVDNGRWHNACRNVLDQKMFDAVLFEKRRLEDEDRR